MRERERERETSLTRFSSPPRDSRVDDFASRPSHYSHIQPDAYAVARFSFPVTFSREEKSRFNSRERNGTDTARLANRR